MGCLDEESVLALVEGTLTSDDRASAEHHLARCAECRTLVARAAEALLSTGAVSAGFADDDGVAPPRAPLSGESVGRYRVTGMLGAGAMGVVVAAHDEQLGREVALKLLRRDASRDVRDRFLREARAASAITHPGVVAIHDVLTTADGHPVIVMDRLEGETLRGRLERSRCLSVAETLGIGRSIAAALEAAHERGVVHRDLKPENVFLARRGDGEIELKLLDFGVAKLLERARTDSAELTATGTIVGTPYYMAPEQAFGQRDVDERADLWSLGVIMYECLSGRRPFSAESVGQVLRLLALGELTPLADVAPEVPAPVVALVERLLSERDQRPASAAEVRRAIDGLEGASLTTSVSPVVRARLVLAAGLAALGVAAGAWVWADRARGDDDPAPLAASSTLEPALSMPVASMARAERAHGEPSPTVSRKLPAARAPAKPSSAPSAGVAPSAEPKTGPGKLLTQPLF